MPTTPGLSFGRIRPPAPAWAAIQSLMPALAPVPEGEFQAIPDRAQNLFRFRHPRKHTQRSLGCCVGKGGADAAEIDQRIVRPVANDVYNPVDPSARFSALWAYYIARRYSASQGRPIGGQGAILSDLLFAVQKWGLIEYDYWPSTPANLDRYRDIPVAGAEAAPKWFPAESGSLRSVDEILYTVGVRQIPVIVGSEWRGGTRTASGGGFTWDEPSPGGHAYTIVGYDKTKKPGRVYIDCGWDDASWGVQPRDGATENGVLLPRGYGWTYLDAWARDFEPNDFASGAVEAIYMVGFSTKDKPAPQPDEPKPEPPAPSPGGVNVRIDTVVQINGAYHRLRIEPL